MIIDERYAAGVLTLEQALAAYGLKETDTAYKAIAAKKWFREDKTGSASGASGVLCGRAPVHRRRQQH